ncbi:hypothetical protein P4O66_021077, partial [Electrophorus voltai]
MWIQIRTIDGKETRTIEDLSRLTKIESLRLKIQEIFNVNPEQQRLFYRGKQGGHDSRGPQPAGRPTKWSRAPTLSAILGSTPWTVMEDGQTLFDYNVGLNDIIQLLIRSQTDPPDSPAPNSFEGVVCSTVPVAANTLPSLTASTATTASPVAVISNHGNGSKPCSMTSDSQPSTSSSAALRDAGVGVYKINELVDCRDISIGAWFEGTIEKVTPPTKAHGSKVETAPPAARVRPSKRTNGKAPEAEPNGTGSAGLHSDGEEPSTSRTVTAAHGKDDVTYHIKYEDYPENGVVEMNGEDVRPRARMLLRFEELEVGQVVMVNYNLELPEERGFWYDAEITSLKHISRTNKEVRVKILLGGPGDVIGDCKLLFLDEIYNIEKPGAPPLSHADGQFKRKSGPECKHCKADPEAECRFCSCCVCGGKQDAHMQLLCDECNMAFHLYCLNPPLSTIPEDEDWYCPTCKNDTSEVVKAGEKLKTSKKKAKMPSATNGSQRDWGKVQSCEIQIRSEGQGHGVVVQYFKAVPTDSSTEKRAVSLIGAVPTDSSTERRAVSLIGAVPTDSSTERRAVSLIGAVPTDSSTEKRAVSLIGAVPTDSSTERRAVFLIRGMACVGRTKECTIVPSNHYGPIPGIPVGTTWKFRVQVSEAGVHRPHVGGIHGRSNDGSYSLVLAGGFEDEVDRGDEFTYTGSGGRDLSGNKRIGEHSFDQTLTHMNRALALNCDAPLNDKDGAESRNWRAGKPVRVIRSSKGRRISKYAPEEGNRYDGIYKPISFFAVLSKALPGCLTEFQVVKYWPEIGKCGFLVWRYLLRRDDVEPAPWTAEGLERSKKLGLRVQ